MATSARLTHFAVLASRIESLGGKARGMRLAADDWNGLVGALVEAMATIGRAQDESRAYLDGAYAPIDHEHPGEVTTLWLEPELRNQVATGGESVPTRQALAAMQKSVAQLRAENARLAERLAALERGRNPRGNLNVTINEDFLRRLRIVEENSITMDAIIKTQNGFKKDVKTLIDLRSALTDEAGAPIDISALSRRITDLDGLRGRLEGVDGKPLSIKDLQLQVLELADRPGGGGGGGGGAASDTGLATIRVDLAKVSQDAETRIERLRDELTSANGQALNQFTVRLNQVEATSREGLAATREQMSATETRLAKGFTDEIGTTRTMLTATLRQQATETVDSRLAGLDARVEKLIGTRTGEIRSQLGDEFRKSLDVRFNEHATGTTGLIDSRFAQFETRIDAATKSIPQELTRGLTAAETRLNGRIDSQIDAKTNALNQSLAVEVDRKLTAGIDAGLLQVRAVADRTVTDRLANLDTRIAASVASATRTLPDQIAATVDGRIQQANIPGQIASANRQLGTELRRDMATNAAALQNSNNAALTTAMVDLRTEMSVQTTRGVEFSPNLRGRSVGPG